MQKDDRSGISISRQQKYTMIIYAFKSKLFLRISYMENKDISTIKV